MYSISDESVTLSETGVSMQVGRAEPANEFIERGLQLPDVDCLTLTQYHQPHQD